jgi:predicted SprT family Zn-dependent metalloprotease
MFSGPMSIPSSFWLYGQLITVRYDPTLSDHTDCVGEARYRTNQIVLQPDTVSTKRVRTKIEHTFLHEVLHYIFYVLGEEELRVNEKLIDSVAALLHQVLTTSHGHCAE